MKLQKCYQNLHIVLAELNLYDDLYVTIVQEVCFRNIFMQLKISAKPLFHRVIVLQNRC